MIVGVTGTTRGLAHDQRATLYRALVEVAAHGGRHEFRHGDCVGVDEQAAEIARGFGYRIVGHPEESGEGRAHVPCDELHPPIEWRARNRALVDTVDLLVGCPAADTEWLGSGTWHAINCARSSGTSLLVISPSGRILEDTRTHCTRDIRNRWDR